MARLVCWAFYGALEHLLLDDLLNVLGFGVRLDGVGLEVAHSLVFVHYPQGLLRLLFGTGESLLLEGLLFGACASGTVQSLLGSLKYALPPLAVRLLSQIRKIRVLLNPSQILLGLVLLLGGNDDLFGVILGRGLTLQVGHVLAVSAVFLGQIVGGNDDSSTHSRFESGFVVGITIGIVDAGGFLAPNGNNLGLV
jgi:hypothetical protein